MFFAFVIFFLILGGLVYWYSVRVQNKAHQHKLEMIRKKIDENEKKKQLKVLEEQFKSDKKKNSE